MERLQNCASVNVFNKKFHSVFWEWYLLSGLSPSESDRHPRVTYVALVAVRASHKINQVFLGKEKVYLILIFVLITSNETMNVTYLALFRGVTSPSDLWYNYGCGFRRLYVIKDSIRVCGWVCMFYRVDHL